MLKPYVENAKKVIVVENNATGQLANLIKAECRYARKNTSYLKYDGNPFLPNEVYKECKELFPWQHLKISATM